MSPPSSSYRRGFTLLEALLALLLASLLMAGIAFYTSGWARQWREVFLSGSQQDVAAIVLDRIVEEIEAAQPALFRNGPVVRSAFAGTSDTVTFVRPALGFEARAGLDRVTYTLGAAGAERAIVRQRRTYNPIARFPGGSGEGEDLPLLRGDVAISFQYATAGGDLSGEWQDRPALPRLVRIEISGNSPRPWRQVAYARPRVEWPAYCASQDVSAQCRALSGGGF